MPRVIYPGSFLKEVQGSIATVRADGVMKLSAAVRKCTRDGGRIFFAGGADLAMHFDTDGQKFGGVRTVCPSVALSTACANDNLKGYQGLFETLQFRKGDMLMAFLTKEEFSTGEISGILDLSRQRKGTNVLIGPYFVNDEPADYRIVIKGQGFAPHIAAHSILHFLGANQEVLIKAEDGGTSKDACAKDFEAFAGMLSSCTDPEGFDAETLDVISQKLRSGIEHDHDLLSFGNGGSAAYSAFFCEGLRQAFGGTRYARNIFDVPSDIFIAEDMMLTHDNTIYGFQNGLARYAVDGEDMLMGISTSGNSENIIRGMAPHTAATKFAVLGDPKSIIASERLADHVWGCPYPGKIHDRAPKFAVLETLQMTALAYIANSIGYVRRPAEDGEPADI